MIFSLSVVSICFSFLLEISCYIALNHYIMFEVC